MKWSTNNKPTEISVGSRGNPNEVAEGTLTGKKTYSQESHLLLLLLLLALVAAAADDGGSGDMASGITHGATQEPSLPLACAWLLSDARVGVGWGSGSLTKEKSKGWGG